MTDSPWLTPAEAAQRARKSADTIGDALRSQELRGYQSGRKGRWTVLVDDLDAWVRGETANVHVPSITRRRAS